MLDALLPAIDMQWVTKEIHEMATAAFVAVRRRELSLADCTSFVMMGVASGREAFASDKHFKEEMSGFPI